MSKIQKILFAVFVVLSLGLAVIAYRSLKNIKQPSVKAISLVPDGSEALIRFDNYPDFANSLRNKNLLWQDIQNMSSLNALEKYFSYLDSIIATKQSFSELVSGNPVYCALYPGSKFLITCNLKELADEKSLKSELEQVFGSATLKLQTDIQTGVLGISNSEEYLIKLFDAKSPKLSSNKKFAALVNEANYSGTVLFLNANDKAEPLKDSYSMLSFKPDRIILNGIKKPDSLEFFGESTAPPSGNLDFLNNIPLICNGFEVYAVANAEKVFNKKRADDWWLSVNDNAMFNAKKQFYNSINGNIVKAMMPSGNHALILPLADTSEISEVLPFISDSSERNTHAILKLMQNTSSFSASSFPQLKLNALNYYVMFEDRMVLTENMADAEIFVNAEKNKTSILDNRGFKQFAAKNFDSEFHYLRYKLINSSNKKDLPINSLLSDNDLKYLKNLSHYSFFATYKNNFLNYRLNLSYLQESLSDEPNLLWTINADNTITSRPFFFKNHITGGNEIVFQTADNNLHFQNATAKELWKKRVGEKIRSDIFIVDAFKNKKYQMLFSTDRYLHLIDRNGNYVQGYPVKLPAKATNRLCVFDYENKNDLRLFVACSDKKIYNYSIYGVKQEGFKTFETSAEVSLPIKYSKVGLSDYLVTADKKGRIYAFSRKGLGRIDFKNKIVEEAEDFELEPGSNLASTQIIYIDKKSSLVEKISLSDKKEIFKIAESDGKAAYCFSDFDKNKITDVIAALSDKVEVYDLNGTKIFSKNLSETINPYSVSFYSNSSAYLNIYDEVNSNDLVFSIEQNTIKTYKSTMPGLVCDLFNDGKIYLLLVLKGELKCFKL